MLGWMLVNCVGWGLPALFFYGGSMMRRADSSLFALTCFLLLNFCIVGGIATLFRLAYLGPYGRLPGARIAPNAPGGFEVVTKPEGRPPDQRQS